MSGGAAGKEEGFPLKKPIGTAKTERRISAALRLVLVAVLLLAQIALVLLLNDLLRQRMAIAYTLLELAALATSSRINSRPGGSYKVGLDPADPDGAGGGPDPVLAVER